MMKNNLAVFFLCCCPMFWAIKEQTYIFKDNCSAKENLEEKKSASLLQCATICVTSDCENFNFDHEKCKLNASFAVRCFVRSEQNTASVVKKTVGHLCNAKGRLQCRSDTHCRLLFKVVKISERVIKIDYSTTYVIGFHVRKNRSGRERYMVMLTGKETPRVLFQLRDRNIYRAFTQDKQSGEKTFLRLTKNMLKKNMCSVRSSRTPLTMEEVGDQNEATEFEIKKQRHGDYHINVKG